MKICDRCYPNNKIIQAYDNVLLGNEQMYVDLCKDCMEEVVKFSTTPKEIIEPKKKRGRPKNSVTAESSH